MWLQRERKDDVIRSDLELGSHLELNAILFQSWSKIRSNSKLPSIIITNISQSSPDTTSWFTEDINILRLTFKVCSLMCTSWSSVNQISNFKFSAFFRFLLALWSLKYTHPKSQQTPRVSTELEIVVNFSYSFIPLKKVLQKGVDRPVENPRKSAENIKMMPNAPNKFYRRTRRQNAPLLEFSIWRTAIPSDWYSITQAQYGKCAKCTKCVGVLCQINLHPREKYDWVPCDMRSRTSKLRTPRSDALPMSHKDSTVIEVYYEFGEEILLKLNFDRNDSDTYREEAGLTFQIIMLNSFKRILIILPHDELI